MTIVQNLCSTDLAELCGKISPITPQAPVSGSILVGNFSFLALELIKLLMQAGAYLFMIAVLTAGAIYIFSFGNEEIINRAKKGIIFSFVGFAVFASANAGLRLYLERLADLAGKTVSLPNIVGEVFNSALIAGGVGFFVVFAYSGLRYFFTGGNEEAASNARRGMLYAFIGMIVLASAFAISTFIIKGVIK